LDPSCDANDVPRLPGARPPAGRQADLGFFNYHGIWAPGVRLFRQLGSRIKALIVSMVLVLPLLALVAAPGAERV
jgi:methyl-accepting chemotaxis protein